MRISANAPVRTEGAQEVGSKSALAMFSLPLAVTKIVLHVAASGDEMAPEFIGIIDGQKASAFLRPQPKHPDRPYLSFVSDDDTPLGAGNLVVNKAGEPLLAFQRHGSVKTEWITITRSVSRGTLLRLGADPAKLHVPLAKREAVSG